MKKYIQHVIDVASYVLGASISVLFLKKKEVNLYSFADNNTKNLKRKSEKI